MKRTFLVFGFYTAIAAAVVYPLLAPGYLFSLDAVATEKVTISSWTLPDYLLSMLLYLLHLVVSPSVLQKGALISALILSGWGMFRFAPVKNTSAKMFAGLLYMINPFTYERLVSGQWFLILGYALLPFTLAQIEAFFKEMSLQTGVKLLILLLLLTNMSVHLTLVAGIFLLVYGVVFLFLHPESWKDTLIRLAVLMLIVLAANSNWIVGLFLPGTPVSSMLSAITVQDLRVFQSVPDPTFGVLFNLLSGYGFWTEPHSYFLSPKSFLPIWPVITLLFFGLTAYGFVLLLKRKTHMVMTLSFAVLFIVCLDLAVGLAMEHTAKITLFLYDRIMLLRGLREPQKLIGIVFFVYAYFGSVGLEAAAERFFRGMSSVIMGLALLLPLVSAIPLFFGFWQQIRPVWYPDSWSIVDERLTRDKDTFYTVIFPWYQYMRYRFMGNRVVLNQAPFFFSKPVLSAQNYETLQLYSHDTRPEGLHVEGLLSIEQEGINLLDDTVEEKPRWGRDLAAIDAKYVLLFKDGDWKIYRFLDKQADLVKEYEDKTLILYKNLAFGLPIDLPQELEKEIPPEDTAETDGELDDVPREEQSDEGTGEPIDQVIE